MSGQRSGGTRRLIDPAALALLVCPECPFTMKTRQLRPGIYQVLVIHEDDCPAYLAMEPTAPLPTWTTGEKT